MGWEMLPPKYDEDRGDWPTGTRCSSDDLYSKSEVKKSVKSYVSKEKYDQLRARNAELEAELAAVMHFVDKWLSGNQLKQSPANRANEAREVALQAIAKLEAEVVRLRKALQQIMYELGVPLPGFPHPKEAYEIAKTALEASYG